VIATRTRPPGQKKELTFKGNGGAGRHGWLRLTPAYSLRVVEDLLAGVPRGEKVLDPFSGTGTTPLVCAAAGIEGHAVDINPFLVWLGNTKLRAFDPAQVECFRRAAASVVERCDAASDAPVWMPALHQIEKWWDPDELAALAALHGRIHAVRRPPEIRDLLRLAFCRVMITSAHVSFGHQSMSFKRRRKEALLFDNSPDTASAYLAACEDIAGTLAVPLKSAQCRVILGDSRELPTVLPGRDYTRVITSPPYPNRMSYIRELRPYMYWLGFLENGRQAGELDWQAIGGTWGCATSMLKDWAPDRAGGIPHPKFAGIVKEIDARHPLLGAYVDKYFHDMRRHLEGLHVVLAPGARCHYVVGNSKFYDTLLPTEELFAALFEACGFDRVGIRTLRKRTSKKELYEFIVEATRPAGAREPGPQPPP
jgi:hypothetical protein